VYILNNTNLPNFSFVVKVMLNSGGGGGVVKFSKRYCKRWTLPYAVLIGLFIYFLVIMSIHNVDKCVGSLYTYLYVFPLIVMILLTFVIAYFQYLNCKSSIKQL